MASEQDNDEKYEAPGIGMRLTAAGISQKFSDVKNISTSQLTNWIKQTETQSNTEQTGSGNLVILDSRPPEEYVVGHIPGSVRVDFEAEPEEILAKVPELQAEGSGKVVCYCSVGYRSCIVAQKLETLFKEQGQTDKIPVYNLWGSLFQWANEGRPMVDGNSKPTVYAHPYNALFGKILKSELRRTELSDN